MPRNITVRFADGTSHVYQNAPDDLTPAQAEARARRDFPNKAVANLDGGRGQPQSFQQAFFGRVGRDLAGLGNPAFQAIAAPTINAIFGPNTVRDFTTRAVQPITVGLADEAVSAVPAVAAARRSQPVAPAFRQSQVQQDQERARIKRERPTLATAADMTGGAMAAALPLPIPGAANFITSAPTVAQTALRAGGVGALQGALTGFLSGDEGQRLNSAGTGALMGGAFGASLPYAASAGASLMERAAPAFQSLMQRTAPAVERFGKAVPAVDDLAGNLAGRMRAMAPPDAPAGVNLPTPDQIALRHLNRNLQTSGLTLDDLRAAPDGITAAEAMGRTGQRQLGALARMEGETGDSLQDLISARVQGRPGALSDAFGRATGVDPDAAAGNIEAVVAAGRRRAAPLYEQAYADTVDLTPTLQGLTSRPAVQKAMRNARNMMLNDGLDPDALGLTVSPQSGDIPIMEVTKRPSMQLWDYVKRGLDDEIDALRDPVTRTFKRPQEARQLTDMAATLRGELTSQSPAYRQALETSGDYLKADAAFKNAPKLLFKDGLSPRAFAAQVAKMTESEKEALRAGIANHALNMVDSGKMRPGAFATRGVRKKLEVILGPEGADELIRTAELEAQKVAFENRYGPGAGSVTSSILAGMDELGQSVGGPSRVGDKLVGVLGSPVETLKKGTAFAINKAVDLATQPGQAAARDAIGRGYMRSPGELAAYLEANPINVPPPIFPGPRAPNPFTSLARPPRPSPRAGR